MTPIEREETQRRARARLTAMRERAKQLRYRVLTGAAISFAVLWVAIFTQMITGHDPVLGPTAATVRPATKEGAAPESKARFTSGGHGAGDGDDHGEDYYDQDEEGSLPVPVEEVVAPVEEEFARPVEELEPATTGQS